MKNFRESIPSALGLAPRARQVQHGILHFRHLRWERQQFWELAHGDNRCSPAFRRF
jgi:hypothetical protein